MGCTNNEFKWLSLKQSIMHCLPQHNSHQIIFFMSSLVCKLHSLSLAFNINNMHLLLFQSMCCKPSRYVKRLGQLVPLLNSQSHQITQCALRGVNSSHKMLKHYLGGHKQLDSLESDTSRQAATGMREGAGKKR